MSIERCDVFPKNRSAEVKRLDDYPKPGSMFYHPKIVHFCLYMKGGKIYFQTRKAHYKVKNSFKAHERMAARFYRLGPDDINWGRVIPRLKSSPDTNKTNADVRTGFRAGNDFLVKAYFTFGQRFVEEGAAHVIQTLNVPLLFYLREPGNVHLKHVRRDKGSFPYGDLCHFDRRILLPNTRYRIPPGTGYILFSTQKNFFRLDVVDEGLDPGFECEDPVRHKVAVMEEMYDLPVKTPYVGDEGDVPDEDLQSYLERESLADFRNPEPTPESFPNADPVSFQNAQPASFAESAQPVSFADQPVSFQNAQPVSFAESFQNVQPASFQNLEPVTVDLTNGENFSDTLGNIFQFLTPPEPVRIFVTPLDRNVVVAHPEFVSGYHSLKWREYGSPAVAFAPSEECCEPMDLSLPSEPQIDRMIEELCTPVLSN